MAQMRSGRRVSGGIPGKSLFVVVVGETARCDHFALNGYARPTNPGFRKSAISSTIRSVSPAAPTRRSRCRACFSGLGPVANFTNAKADVPRENLLDIFKRAGLDVLWRENQSGCKGVCARMPTETLTGTQRSDVLPEHRELRRYPGRWPRREIAKLERDTVIVLHMMGSHGPAYWKRYPETFETFKPACKDSTVQPLRNPRASSTPTTTRSSIQTMF